MIKIFYLGGFCHCAQTHKSLNFGVQGSPHGLNSLLNVSAMLTIISFTSAQIYWGLATLVGLIAVAIIIGRVYMARESESNLTEKYRGHKWSSPLEARNKYPEVDIFRYSSLMFRFSLILSLGIIVLGMNWSQIEKKVFIPQDALDMAFDLEVETPRSAEPPAPPPPPPPPVIEAVPDNLLLDETPMDFRDNSMDQDADLGNTPPPAPAATRTPPPPPPPPPADEPEIVEIFKVVEEMPRFPGCEDLTTQAEKKTCSDQKLLAFIYENISYPSIARENGVEGTVVVRFVVNEKGEIAQAEAVRDIGAGCGDEALRVINLMNNMPARWVPGRQRGRAVKVYYTLPVKFILKANS